LCEQEKGCLAVLGFAGGSGVMLVVVIGGRGGSRVTGGGWEQNRVVCPTFILC